MSKYKESTLKTYANKLERKFKNDCYFVNAIPDSYSELLIGASVIFDNQGIKNKYYIDCWLLEDGNIRIEVFKNDARLKNVYYSVEVLSLNYAIDYIHEYITNDNEETASNSESEKHYDDYTSEDFIESGIAKECTVCPDFCEDSIENAECAKGNDVFEGCETVKDQYFDTDCLHPNKTIIAKIENINSCPNQNTCCIVSPYVPCDYNYKSESCIKAHKNFNHYCEQVHKQLKAKHKPEWHHVRLATLASIDFDMLDEKRKLVCNINQILKDGIRNLYKCKNHIAYEALERDVLRKCDELIRHNHLKAFWFSYIAQQLDEVRRNTIYLYAPYITIHRNRW